MNHLQINSSQTPSQLGFMMPAEWEPHACTLLTWPVIEEWPCKKEDILSSYAKFVTTLLSVGESLVLHIKKEFIEDAKEYLGKQINDIKLIVSEYDDSWVRDNGPIFIIRNTNFAEPEIAATKWQFNAWGEKYSFAKDNQLAYATLDTLSIPYFEPSMVLEGGSICVDGEGTLLTTNQCLNELKRNPHLSPHHVDQELKNFLGVQKVIRLQMGLVGDHTDGHIDNVACFLRPGTILIQLPSDPMDPNYSYMKENYQILKHATDAKGRSFEIITIDQPKPILYEGVEYCVSYINLYFAGNAVLVPVFGGVNDQLDRAVLERLQTVFQDQRKIIPVEGNIFPLGGGNIHCKTQQVPRGTPYLRSSDIKNALKKENQR